MNYQNRPYQYYTIISGDVRIIVSLKIYLDKIKKHQSLSIYNMTDGSEINLYNYDYILLAFNDEIPEYKVENVFIDRKHYERLEINLYKMVKPNKQQLIERAKELGHTDKNRRDSDESWRELVDKLENDLVEQKDLEEEDLVQEDLVAKLTCPLNQEPVEVNKSLFNQSYPHLFCSSKQAFDVNTLNIMCVTAKTFDEVENIKKYISTYFIKIGGSPIFRFWVPGDKQIKDLSYSDAEKTYFRRRIIKIDGYPNFDVYQWFMEYEPNHCTPTWVPDKDRIFKRDDCSLCVNEFAGWFYDSEPNGVSTTTLEGVDVIMNHLKVAICSLNEEQYSYLINWLACSQGRKLRTALMWRLFMGGIGKGIFTNFFITKILGYNISASLLMVVDEPIVKDWNNVGEGIKYIITELLITIRKRNQNDKVNVPNYMNMIFTCNSDNIKIGASV
ncbi:hypothetical protein DDB_G0293464 [Dictyostelium discoideum AX4]|uniref:Uncharacterized protein n=1 Tax=Dictyostelium discoideum TaxID=44689 RepID=Q54BS7_DICDI|nr:hypothetical protein DDB_G0293464 [Dictyostelium discoideum AX4]EAL60716.1 hypothetical protein DDB_G0293464 [Dictyostelium discoideum AX4]|eukprot:XP_629124.1 hypothetical protein DDB_G0293464 [Dictyostelium discoideum AX4]